MADRDGEVVDFASAAGSGPRGCPGCTHTCLVRLGKRSDLVGRQRLEDEYGRFVDDVDRFDREIWRCTACGLRFAHPMYVQADFEALYAQEGYKLAFEAWFGRNGSHFDDRERAAAKAKYEAVGLGRFCATVAAAGRSPRLLDVGCGRGLDLVVATDLGFDVHGIDLNADHVDLVRRKGISAEVVSLADFKPASPFDCVLASHVIEHVDDPRSFLAEMTRVLAPSGVIVVETPMRFDSGNEDERYRDIYHTLFFDPFSLAVVAARAGLRTRASTMVSFRLWGQHLFFLLTVLERDRGLDEVALPGTHLAALRSAYEGVHGELCRLARRDLVRAKIERTSRHIVGRAVPARLTALVKRVMRG